MRERGRSILFVSVMLLASAVSAAERRAPLRRLPQGSRPSGPKLAEPSVLHARDTGASGSVYVPEGATVKTSCHDAVVHVSICKDGSCSEVLSYSTAPYGCNPAGTDMNTHCTSASDCSTGCACNQASSQCVYMGYTCKDAFTVVGVNGTEESCSPYLCKAGRCQSQCNTTAECADGYDCMNHRACVEKGLK